MDEPAGSQVPVELLQIVDEDLNEVCTHSPVALQAAAIAQAPTAGQEVPTVLGEAVQVPELPVQKAAFLQSVAVAHWVEEGLKVGVLQRAQVPLQKAAFVHAVAAAHWVEEG